MTSPDFLIIGGGIIGLTLSLELKRRFPDSKVQLLEKEPACGTLRERKLEMDFRYQGDARSFHVLNAVSPAFTCAMPFSRHLVDQIAGLVR